MLSLPNIAQRHGKITGSNRVMYPLSNDPALQNRLYWTEEFDEEFLQATGKLKNHKKTNNMNTSKLKGFTYGATTSQPYAMANGGTDYNQYGQTFNTTLGLLKDFFGPKNTATQPAVTTPVYTPPAPSPTPTNTTWSTSTKIAVGVGSAVVLVGAFFGIRALVRKGK